MMEAQTGYIVALITTSSAEEAEKIGRALVEERLAACINIVKEVRSLFLWQGKLEDEREALMVVKTTSSLFPALAEKVKSLHAYTVPEIIALPIQVGSDAYLRWIDEVTT